MERATACFSYIEGFYNPVRPHAALGYKSSMTFEQENTPEIATHT